MVWVVDCLKIFLIHTLHCTSIILFYLTIKMMVQYAVKTIESEDRKFSLEQVYRSLRYQGDAC